MAFGKATTVGGGTFGHVLVRTAGLMIAIGVLSACSGEASTPIDLRATTTTEGPPISGVPLPEDDPNAEAREQVRQLAEQQCLDDPSKTEGVIRIVEPETEEIVGELIVDCAEVRAANE